MPTSASIGALFSRNAAVGAALLLVSFVPRPGGAQSTVSGGFVAGSRQIWAMDLTSLSPEGLPRGVTWSNGAAKVVTKNGVPMIQATDRTDLLIRLPEALPSAFTIQLEITPKSDGAPEDVALEGTSEVNRGDASMQIVWQVISLMAVGGGEMFQMPMPDSIALTLPLRPVPIDVSFDGGTVRLFTDGKLLMNLTNHQFVRGGVLRVTLGGGCREFQTKCATAVDEDRYSVYLSRLRIAASSVTVALATSTNMATLATGTPTEVVPTGVMPVSTSAPKPVAAPPNPSVISAPVTSAPPNSPASRVATTSSSPTNPLPVVSTTTQSAETLQQAAIANPPPTASTPTPVSRAAPLSPTSPSATGPATLTAKDFSASSGWGVNLTWPPLSGVTTYWVARKLTRTTDPATYVDVIFVPTTDGSVQAVDPRVDPNLQYTYWVVGYTRNIGETKPSPIATVGTGNLPQPIQGAKIASVSAPSMLTMPGPLASISPMLGSTVTLTWVPRAYVYLYKISYQIIGSVTGVGPVATTLEVPFRPYGGWDRTLTLNVPQGKTVHLCVDFYGATPWNYDKQNCASATAP